MFFRSTTMALRPAWISEINLSPNSFAVVLSSRPYASTTVTSSVTSSTSFMPDSRSLPTHHRPAPAAANPSLQLLRQPQPVDAVAARVFVPVGQAAHEVQPYSALGTRLCTRTRRRREPTVDRPAIILPHDFDVAAAQREPHENIVMRGVVVTVGDDVVENLVKRHVEHDDDLVRELVAGAEPVPQVGHPRDLGYFVGDADLAG